MGKDIGYAALGRSSSHELGRGVRVVSGTASTVHGVGKCACALGRGKTRYTKIVTRRIRRTVPRTINSFVRCNRRLRNPAISNGRLHRRAHCLGISCTTIANLLIRFTHRASSHIATLRRRGAALHRGLTATSAQVDALRGRMDRLITLIQRLAKDRR